jgi:hypothetical protein
MKKAMIDRAFEVLDEGGSHEDVMLATACTPEELEKLVGMYSPETSELRRLGLNMEGN